MNIRPALPEDLPALMAMAGEFHSLAPFAGLIPFCPASMADTFEKLATDRNNAMLVAENDDGLVIGMAAGISFPHWVNKNHKAAQELFWWCNPGERGKGAGMALANALEEWAKEVGAKTLFMASTSNLKTDKLAKLYARRGFLKQDIYYAKGVQSCPVQ